MCVVSMVGEVFEGQVWGNFSSPITRMEFEALKREVELLKGLLAAAKVYDWENNEPDCETDEKMKRLKEIAEIVGIDLDEVLSNKGG